MDYRIPTIDEFEIDFEYQVYSEGLHEDSIEDFCGWYEYNFMIGDCFRDLEDIESELRNGNIRVKCIENEKL